MAARYLVTGGAGFIGSSIARALLARGDAVTVLDDLSTGRESNLAGLTGDIELVRGDVCDEEVASRLVHGVRAIYHQAAVASVVASIADPARCDRVNVHGTVVLLEAARRRGVSRFVLAASAAAYGDSPGLPKRESMRPEPLSPYAASKVAAEDYVRVYARLHGMHAVALRYFNVFGPGQDPASDYAAVVPKFVAAIAADKAPVIFEDGEQTRDFCFIDDVVAANLAAIERPEAAGLVINVANGESVSIRELARVIGEIFGSSLEPTFEPARPGDIRHSLADITLAREALGYEPKISVEDGLRRTVAHFGAAS